MPNVKYMFDSAFAEIYVNRMGKLKEFKTLPPFLPACFIRLFFRYVNYCTKQFYVHRFLELT